MTKDQDFPDRASGRRSPASPAAAARMLVSAAGFAMLALGGPAAAAEFNLPQGPGRSLVYAKCRVCHDLQYVVESKGISPTSWDGLLDDMEGFGVELTADERTQILLYLATYMSSNPPPAAPTEAQEGTATANGKQVFFDNCTSCHQEDAKGVEETFPPLASNTDLFLARDFPVKVLLNGMAGTIKVNGATFEGEMPPFGHLSDGEVAAVVNFLRGSFGNGANAPADMKPLTPEDVATARGTAMTPDEVLAYRASLE